MLVLARRPVHGQAPMVATSPSTILTASVTILLLITGDMPHSTGASVVVVVVIVVVVVVVEVVSGDVDVVSVVDVVDVVDVVEVVIFSAQHRVRS